MTTHDPESVRRLLPIVQVDDEPPTDLLTAVNQLSATVTTLTERVDLPLRVARRTRALQVILIGVFLAVSAFGAIQWQRVTNAVELDKANAVIACRNANDARTANLELWDYVLDLTEKTSPPASKQMLEEIRNWVGLLYAQHDCSDLTQTYVIPPPPSV